MPSGQGGTYLLPLPRFPSPGVARTSEGKALLTKGAIAGTNPIHNKKPKKKPAAEEDDDDKAFKAKQQAGTLDLIMREG
jgi:hypothetical protein